MASLLREWLSINSRGRIRSRSQQSTSTECDGKVTYFQVEKVEWTPEHNPFDQ